MSIHHQIFPLLLLSILLLNGCGGVEWQHKHPSLKNGEPFALLNEESPFADNITSAVKGFYENRQNPGEIKEPVMKEYSAGEAAMKTLYTMSPYGWMTLPFADFEGRTIAIPTGETGIVIHRKYYKELSREKIAVLEQGDMVSFKSPQSVANTVSIGQVGTVLYEVKFENLEWDDRLWLGASVGEEYKLILSQGIIRDSHNKIVAGNNTEWLSLPVNMQPKLDQKVVTDGGQVLGKRYLVAVDGKITIFDENDDISVGIIRDTDTKPEETAQHNNGTPFFNVSNPVLISPDKKDVVLHGEAPDGQRAKITIPSGKGFAAATVLSEEFNEPLTINVNKWINKLLETNNQEYVEADLSVTPIMSEMGEYSMTKQDAEMVNSRLKTRGVELRVFPSDIGLEATRMVDRW